MMPEPKVEPTLSSPRTTPQVAPPGEVNYGFRHRGTVLLVTGSGVALRMELYQRRDLERLSLDN